jgi:hypothetical protein
LGEAWPTDDNPWAPFDLVRMFRESDLVIRCSVRACLYELPGGKLRWLRLVNTVDRLRGIYKGEIQADLVEWKVKRQLIINVLVDARHSGHWGGARPDFGKPHLLFLQKVPAKELAQRGYAKEPGTFYKVNRIRHGLIRLYGDGPRRFAKAGPGYRESPYRNRLAFWRDLLAATDELSSDSRTTPSKARVAATAYRAKLYEALGASAGSGKAGQADSALEGVPAAVLDGCEAVGVYRALVAEKDPEARKKLVARIEFMAVLAKDLATFAAERRAAATKPDGATTKPAKGKAGR